MIIYTPIATIMKRSPVIVLDNGASSIKVGVTTSPKDVR